MAFVGQRSVPTVGTQGFQQPQQGSGDQTMTLTVMNLMNQVNDLNGRVLALENYINQGALSGVGAQGVTASTGKKTKDKRSTKANSSVNSTIEDGGAAKKPRDTVLTILCKFEYMLLNVDSVYNTFLYGTEECKTRGLQYIERLGVVRSYLQDVFQLQSGKTPAKQKPLFTSIEQVTRQVFATKMAYTIWKQDGSAFGKIYSEQGLLPAVYSDLVNNKSIAVEDVMRFCKSKSKTDDKSSNSGDRKESAFQSEDEQLSDAAKQSHPSGSTMLTFNTPSPQTTPLVQSFNANMGGQGYVDNNMKSQQMFSIPLPQHQINGQTQMAQYTTVQPPNFGVNQFQTSNQFGNGPSLTIPNKQG